MSEWYGRLRRKDTCGNRRERDEKIGIVEGKGIKGGGTQRRVGRNWASDDVGEDVDRFHRVGDREC